MWGSVPRFGQAGGHISLPLRQLYKESCFFWSHLKSIQSLKLFSGSYFFLMPPHSHKFACCSCEQKCLWIKMVWVIYLSHVTAYLACILPLVNYNNKCYISVNKCSSLCIYRSKEILSIDTSSNYVYVFHS